MRILVSGIKTETTVVESGYLAPDGSNNAWKVSGTNHSLTEVVGNSLLSGETRSIYARTVSGEGKLHLCSWNGNTNNLFDITEQWQRFEVNTLTTSTGANSSMYAVDLQRLI